MTSYLVVVAPQVAEAAPETSWFQRRIPISRGDFMIPITKTWLEYIN